MNQGSHLLKKTDNGDLSLASWFLPFRARPVPRLEVGGVLIRFLFEVSASWVLGPSQNRKPLT